MALPFSFSSELKWSPHLNSMHGPFENGSNLYAVLLDLTNLTYEVWKSTDSGNSWSEQDSASHPAIGSSSSFRSVNVIQSGATLYILRDSSGTAFATFSMSSDTWSATTTGGGNPAAGISGTVPYHGAVRSDGDVIIFHHGVTESIMGTNYRRVKYSRYEGGVWTNSTDVGGTGAQAHYDARTAVLGSSDRVHFFWTDFNNQDLKHRSLSSANVLGTIQDIDATAGTGSFYDVGLPALNGSEIVLPYRDLSNDLNVARATSADTPTWDITQVVTTTNDPETVSSNLAAVAVDSGTVHVFWPNDADQDIYRDNDAGTGTWGTDAEWKDAVTCQGINIAKITGGVGVLYVDGGTVKYDLFSAGPVTQNATSSPGIQAALAPTARLEAQASATPGIQAALSGTATRIQLATATAGIQAALGPAGTLLAQASASPGVQAALAPTARYDAQASSTPGIQVALGPSGVDVLQATSTPGIRAALGPVATLIQLATATPGITVALGASADLIGTAAPGITVALAPAATAVLLTTATPGVTVALAPSGTLLGLATATPGVTVALAPTGRLVGLTSASPGITAALAPTAIKVTSSTSALAITAALSGTGVVVKVASSALAITVALAPSSTAIGVTSASPGVTVALAPSGLATVFGQALPAITLALTVTADVIPLTVPNVRGFVTGSVRMVNGNGGRIGGGRSSGGVRILRGSSGSVRILAGVGGGVGGGNVSGTVEVE